MSQAFGMRRFGPLRANPGKSFLAVIAPVSNM